MLFANELSLVGKTIVCLDRRWVAGLQRKRLGQRERFASARIDARRSTGWHVAESCGRLNSVALSFGFQFDLLVHTARTFSDDLVLLDDSLFAQDIGVVTRRRRSSVC